MTIGGHNQWIYMTYMDYKMTVNQATRPNTYLIPRIKDLYVTLLGGQLFTTLDLKNAYNQVSIGTYKPSKFTFQ